MLIFFFFFHGIYRVLNNQKRDQADLSKHDFSALSYDSCQMAEGYIGNMATVELATIFLSPYNFPFHLPNLSIYMLISCCYIKSG